MHVSINRVTKYSCLSINRVHHSQLVSSQQLLPIMDQLRVHSKEQVTKLRVSTTIEHLHEQDTFSNFSRVAKSKWAFYDL